MSIYGTLDGVFAARHQLLGCLPLVLMFDLPDESGKSIRDGKILLKPAEVLTYIVYYAPVNLVVNTKGARLITCVSYRCEELSNATAGCVH